jgi:hypothetical protein
MTLVSEGKMLTAALDVMRQSFDEVQKFVTALASSNPGLALVAFDQPISPKRSRVEAVIAGKERQFQLTIAVTCPIPPEADYWTRLKLLARLYDQFAELSERFRERKNISLELEEAKLDQEKGEPPEPVRPPE